MTTTSSSPPAGGDELAVRVARATRRMPLAAHADLPVSEGQDPVAILHAQSESRVAELVPVRYGRMLASPFAFYRGSAAIMAADLGAGERSGIDTQLCGDAHISNFGLFASAERRLMFDLNDFDETWPGPFEWDVKRLAASLEIAGRANGLKRRVRADVVETMVRAYRESMATFAGQSTLEVWYARAEMQPGLPRLKELLPKTAHKKARSVVDKSLSRDSAQAMSKLTTTIDGERRFVSDPPIIVPLRDFADQVADELTGWLERLLDVYRDSLQSDRQVLFDRFRLVDIARKAVGVGSVGSRAFLLMLLDEAGSPLVLQAKEAVASVLSPYSHGPDYDNQGRRVVEGQRLMQASSDLLLGWQHSMGIDGIRRDYYVRQFRDWKGGYEIEGLDLETFQLLAQLCAWTLARAHARSGDRAAMAGYLGETEEFDHAVSAFAVAYADKNDRDYAALEAAAAAGRVPVTRNL